MALYEVSRADIRDIKPGEFVSALVIAGGTAQARDAVRHLEGVTAKNVVADRLNVVADVAILSVEHDEREAEPSADPLPFEDDESGLWKS
jgi:hypothetical protein